MSASRSTTMEINASSLRQARGSPLSPPPAAGHESDDAPSAGRSDPPPTSSLDLPRTAEARGLGANHDRGKVELRDVLGEQVEVGYEALRLVLDYLYSGRVAALPKAACLCVDEDACPHVGCRPAVAFMAQVVFAASTFDVAELTNLFQVLWENSGHDLSAL